MALISFLQLLAQPLPCEAHLASREPFTLFVSFPLLLPVWLLTQRSFYTEEVALWVDRVQISGRGVVMAWHPILTVLEDGTLATSSIPGHILPLARSGCLRRSPVAFGDSHSVGGLCLLASMCH